MVVLGRLLCSGSQEVWSSLVIQRTVKPEDLGDFFGMPFFASVALGAISRCSNWTEWKSWKNKEQVYRDFFLKL